VVGERKLLASAKTTVFLSRAGGRLSKRSVDDVVRRVGKDAGLTLSPHALRHTCLTALVRRGTDLVMVAELAGHRRVDTTRRYSMPSDADRRIAMEGSRSTSDADPVPLPQRD
jgi:site-specific recombinase XerD